MGWGRKHSVVDYVFSYEIGRLYEYHNLVMFECCRRGIYVDTNWFLRTYRGKKLGVRSLTEVGTYVHYQGEIIYPDDKGVFNVPSSTSKISIRNHIFTYSLTNPLVTYWLDGFEVERITKSSSDMEEVHYTNLEGGTYHFTMILQDAFGKGSNHLDITIKKAKRSQNAAQVPNFQQIFYLYHPKTPA